MANSTPSKAQIASKVDLRLNLREQALIRYQHHTADVREGAPGLEMANIV